MNEQRVIDLHDCKIQNADGPDKALKDFGVKVGDLEVIFNNHEQRLIEFIQQQDSIVGCVAWMTNDRILRAMAKCSRVAIVVQKEDFLRPDMGNENDWNERLRSLYRSLPSFGDRYSFRFLGGMSMCSGQEFEAVRCVGNYNSDKKPAFPRMHNKFIVGVRELAGKLCPVEVWTGCFNFTTNATRSFENVVVISNKEVASAYMSEFEQIMALSEPLNWESEWVFPEWRIGT